MDDDDRTTGASGIALEADIARAFTYASFQNAVPVIRSIRVANSSHENFEQCTLELTSSPPFFRPKTWTIDRVLAGDTIALNDRKVELDATYLAGLNEAERGEITLRLSARGKLLLEEYVEVRLLARDEWGGVDDMAQLLPAFVMPNDPAVGRLLKMAADQLARHGRSSALDGYQSDDPKRSFMLVGAIYSAIAGLRLHYAQPPASFEHRGQKIRRPTTVETERLATCLDTTLLFAAAIEAVGLRPVVLLFRDHAAVGAWLTPRTLANATEPDAMEVRKALASRELIVFETTGVTHRPPMMIQAARRAIDQRIEEAQADQFVAAIDVHRARSQGITPLASHERIREGASPVIDDPGSGPLPLPPDLEAGSLPPEEIDVKPTTPAGRIARWQKKLLDLTLRNRLLNFPESKKTIPFLCTDVGFLEDRLAAGAAIRLISLPEQNPLGQRDAALFRDVHGRDLQRGFAAEALARDELASPLEAKTLEARLIDLHRQVRNDFAEGGANTLFLAVGFLRWKRKADDERIYRAPLLLIPVKLERRSASSTFTLRFHEDEPRFNATLLQFLHRDFALDLPQFAGDLPSDESGVDVQRVLMMMRQAVRDVPGMEVVEETALSTFSFAKFLMWKDLVERTDALRQNRVVRHLIDTPEQPFHQGAGRGVFRDARDIDRHYAPSDIVCLLPADSSQIAASVAAAEGADFVVIGPPGTGKSQTIANMIANCLAVGKTVLFVAEKTAALDVVYRRLREHGLGAHALELHSSKADRRRFLAQLKASWESPGPSRDGEWITLNDRLRVRRDELNGYVDALHRHMPNGWTPYHAIGIALRGRDLLAPALSWDRADQHDEAAFAEIEGVVHDLSLAFRSVRMHPALHLVQVTEWSSRWQGEFLAASARLQTALAHCEDALAAFEATLGLSPSANIPPDQREALVTLADAIERSAGHDIRIAFDGDLGQMRPAAVELREAIARYGNARDALSARYDENALPRLDVDDIERQWREANAAFWPNGMLGKRRVQKYLQGFASAGTADPDRDLQPLRIMAEARGEVARSPLTGKPLAFAGINTDVAALERTIALAEAVRAALVLPRTSSAEARAVVQAISAVLSGATGTALQAAALELLHSAEAVRTELGKFTALGGRLPNTSADGLPDAASRTLLDQLEACGTLFRDWSVWCGTKETAVRHGLDPLVRCLEAEQIPAQRLIEVFHLAYARWWLPLVLDADPVLRGFRRFQHEHAIEEFQDLDDMVRTAATRRVERVIAHGLPSVESVPRNSELGTLRHQMQLQRPSRSIREMIAAMPGSFRKLAPCMLMSPLSIAQYLPPDHALFDVVIFDEASQITTWDAVGAIARARQTIIVGDPKQLPPTNFFGRNEEEGDEIADHEKDLESILDEAKAAGIPMRDLRWHYRSRSESLIAFSNHHYYQNRLITFPGPNVDDQAVKFRKVAGVYDRGKSRTNRIEAEAVAREAVGRMTAWLALDERTRPTLGIITFNAQQQSLILDLLDHARRKDAELEWYFAEDRVEPTIVKNLENVQGDERDVILFSITFSQDAAGRRTMDFGALNRDGGERRLNVAITRARQELVVFSGFTADQIDPARTKALGPQHLKAFLDFAERGAIALPAQDKGSLGGAESPFEEAVATELAARGWLLVPQVGISGFRIDIGVKYPDHEGAYLAGVECDGAAYHSSATARDRDKVREQVLRGLGWNIERIWSTDWWFDPSGCAERLHERLLATLEADREKRARQTEADAVVHWDIGHEIEPSPEEEEAPEKPPEEVSDATPLDEPAEVVTSQPSDAGQVLLAQPSAVTTAERYHITDLSGFAADPGRYYDFDYNQTLREMVDAVLTTEAPLRVDILAQRIARAHGWLRTGARIRERVELHLRHAEFTEESSGRFVWRKTTVVALMPFRHSAGEEARRGIADIPIAELASVVATNPSLLDQRDPALDLARLLGVERLAAVSRTRLEEAIERARDHLAT